MKPAAAVEVETPDGLVLRGEEIIRSGDWAVLVHDLGEDIDAWRPVPSRLASDGMSVVTLDLRGHGGSEGEPDGDAVGVDLATAFGHARGRGAGRIFLAAAGRPCSAVADAAVAGHPTAVIVIAPRLRSGDWGRIPRLAVVGSIDPDQQRFAAAFRKCPGWAVVAHVPFDAPGLGVLRTPWGSNVVEYMAGFFKGQRRTQPKVA